MNKTLLSIVAGCLLFTNAWAEHEADHRYNVRGFVLDANQKSVGNLTVQAFADAALLGSATTDGDGYYSLHLHLHDADYGRILKLRAGSLQADLRVEFDVGDSASTRIHEANFVAGKFVEGDLGRFRIPTWIYPVGGLLLIILGAVFLEKRRKKKINLAKHSAGEKHSASAHKSSKARRKKH